MNIVACHGIPNTTKFKQGDFFNLDLTVYYKGMHSDTSSMVTIGKIDPIIQNLVRKSILFNFRLKYLKSLYIKEYRNANQEIK